MLQISSESFEDDAAVGLDGDLGTALFVDLEVEDRGLAGRLIDVVTEGFARGEHRQVEGECQRLFEGVEACDVPFAVSTLAGEDDVAAGITVDETCFLPGGGKATQEVQFELRQLVEVVRLDGDTLHGGLHDDARGHLEDVRRVARMTALVVGGETFVHDDASPVHRGCGIAAEGMEREVEGLFDGGSLVEEHVL